MINRINLISLGVRDLKRSRDFYRSLGFVTPGTEDEPEIVFFNNNGTKLALYPLDLLAQDIDEQSPPVLADNNLFTGITLAFNAQSKEEVDTIFSRIEDFGGTVVKTPRVVFWGGYSGYFRDLDGYYWEVSYSADWHFDSNDMLIIE